MTCSEFEDMVDLLAADKMVDDVTRQRAMKHCSTCAECSMRLADERIISAGLAALAAETARDEAPARLRMALQQKFAEMQAHNQFAAIAKSPDNILAFPGHLFQRRTVLILAAAASILALVALTWQIWRPAFSTGNPETIAGVELPIPSPTFVPSAPKEIDNPKGLNRKSETASSTTEFASSSTRLSTRPVEAKSEPETEQVDFIPLTYVSDTVSLHSGTVVRVEVQRTTLLAMGLPVNAARDDTLIKADLVVGDDGVARAIRFVQ